MEYEFFHWGFHPWSMYAIIATLFGSATSLGLGALQITGGLATVFGTEG